MTESTSTVQFDSSRAQRYSPNKVLKIGRVVEKRVGEQSVIDAEWGEKQVFVGTYVEILNQATGHVMYGSAYQEWMNTHATWDGVRNGWYKSAPVDAYQADTAGTLVTTLGDGTVETSKQVNPGDWLVQQQDGEIMCISAGKFPTLYDVSSARPVPQS